MDITSITHTRDGSLHKLQNQRIFMPPPDFIFVFGILFNWHGVIYPFLSFGEKSRHIQPFD